MLSQRDPITVCLASCVASCDKFIRVSSTYAGYASSFKWTSHNMISWGLWIFTISSISTSDIHGVAAIHLAVSLAGMVAIQQAGICTLLKDFRFVIFVTALWN